jgi:predicted nucleic acid-binding protein
MLYLADTNVIARRVLPADAKYPVVCTAVDRLLRRGETICVTAQNLIEFRALATRPLSANGLGLTPEEARERSSRIEAVFDLLPETPDVYRHWRRLADLHGVTGRQVFDTRLVAVMLTHGVTHILTLDAPHFRRFVADGITVVEPHEVSEVADEE